MSSESPEQHERGGLDQATIDRLKEQGVEFVRVLNIDAIHMPEDAGEYRDGLLDIMLRIPDGWGRWIRVEKGWYPLICELDRRLSELFPDYVLHQVKQKFGSLSYYWEPPTDDRAFEDPDDLHPHYSRDGDYEDRLAECQERQVVYRERVGLADEYAEIQRRTERANALVAEAEQRSQRTCELCSADGQASQSDAPHPWILILCDACRPLANPETPYLTVPEWREKYRHAG